MPSTINASSSSGLITTADTSTILQLQTNGTTAVTISSGQVATFAQAPVLPAASIPQAALAANVAGNGPTFSVYRNAAQSISNSTFTKIQFDTKIFDTATAFDVATNYRFQPTVAGYYQINGIVSMTGSTVGVMGVEIYKTGTAYMRGSVSTNNTGLGGCSCVSSTIYLNGSTDYVELYVWQGSGGALNIQTGSNLTQFSGALVRSA